MAKTNRLLAAILLLLAFVTGCMTMRPTTMEIASEKAAVPNVYRFMDFTGGYADTWDAVQYYAWYQIEPSADNYAWSTIDAKLAAVYPKKVQLCITAGDSDIAEPYFFTDNTPSWVYSGQGRPVVNGRTVGHKLTAPDGSVAVLPAYDDRSTWWVHMLDLVADVGAHYDGHPQVTSIVIGAGLDGETQPVKDANGHRWPEIMRQQAPDVEYRFGGTNQLIDRLMAAYHTAWPTTQVYLNCAPGGNARSRWAQTAASYGGHIGLKHSGMWVDLDSHQGYGTFVGSWDHIRAYSQTLPIWVESPFGLGDAEHRYWSIYAGLHYHPQGMNLHPEYFGAVDAEMLEWARDHLGTTIEDTPSVWAVLRDAEYPVQMWTATDGCSGHMGDWTQWLTRTRGGERVWREQLPAGVDVADWRSRQVRMGTAMAFDVDGRFVRNGYTIYVTLLDWGGDVIVRWRKADGLWGSQIWKFDNTGEWVQLVTEAPGLNVAGVEDVLIEGSSPLYIHGVEIEGVQNITPTVTICTPTATATPTHTYTPAPTWTKTPTLTATPTAFYPTPQPTNTRTVEEEMAALQDRYWEERGAELRFWVEVEP